MTKHLRAMTAVLTAVIVLSGGGWLLMSPSECDLNQSVLADSLSSQEPYTTMFGKTIGHGDDVTIYLGSTFECAVLAPGTLPRDYDVPDGAEVELINPRGQVCTIVATFTPATTGTYNFRLSNTSFTLKVIESAEPESYWCLFDSGRGEAILHKYLAYPGSSIEVEAPEFTFDGINFIYESTTISDDSVLSARASVVLTESITVREGDRVSFNTVETPTSVPSWMSLGPHPQIMMYAGYAELGNYQLVAGNGTVYNIEVVPRENAGAVILNSQTSDGETAIVGSSIILPSPGDNPGYVFDGWYTAESGVTKVGMAGDDYVPDGIETLYAHWTYELTFPTPSFTLITEG